MLTSHSEKTTLYIHRAFKRSRSLREPLHALVYASNKELSSFKRNVRRFHSGGQQLACLWDSAMARRTPRPNRRPKCPGCLAPTIYPGSETV